VRTGIFISSVSHVVLVALALLGTPKLFEDRHLETIEVDLVRAQELEPEPSKEPEKKPPEKTAEWNPFSEAAAAQAKAPPPETPTPPTKQKQPQPTQEARAPQPPEKEPATQKGPTSQTSPQERPMQQALAPQPPTDAPADTPQQSWIFDPVHVPTLMSVPNTPQGGFDSESAVMANLSTDERTAFKAHLKKCWKLPDGVSAAQSTRVTLRVFLKQNGALAAEPMLIEASASREGPLLLQAAIRSVKECQPFGFLPPDKYREWKTLDVSFSPKEMGGG